MKNCHTVPTSLAALLIAGSTAAAKSYIIPHVLDTKGDITARGNATDFSIITVYSGGSAGQPPGEGAQVAIYLYNDDGTPMSSATGQEVGNPIVFSLSADFLKKKITKLQDRFKEAGGFPAKSVSGFAIIVVSGDDASVHVQGFVVNSHTSPFDLSMSPVEAQPIAAPVR